ncbi:phage exclusion protein Lit family protein [Mucilaginibacter sp. McL0603]|uniref:phage exclusion protein Lit family protein n=1 Tax=Mucilaginibacter sp. McL0603 TaxID=3415670 RepID=UPI003CF42420
MDDAELEAILKQLSIPKEEMEEIKKSWVFQESGEINQLKDHHVGTQPIRVVHNMVLHMFANTYPAFKEKLQKLVDEGKLNPKINLVLKQECISGDGLINTPRVSGDSRQICVHETFLSYLWCVSYAVYILYIEKVDYPKLNKAAGKIIYPVSQVEIDKAMKLFDYGKSLIAYFSEWDIDALPNPEKYLAENRNYVEQSSMCYTEAVSFILAHELTHLERHIDELNENTPDSHYLNFEIEADKEAIFHTIQSAKVMGPKSVNSGIVVALLSMLYFSSVTSGKRHPNVEDRITTALELLNIDEFDPAWGMACVGLELWEQQFNLNFEWLQDSYSPQQQYYHLLKQIKSRN